MAVRPRTIVPSFPKAAQTTIPGGKFGGALLGIETATKLSEARAKRSVEERGVALKERGAAAQEERNLIRQWEIEVKPLVAQNAALIKANPGMDVNSALVDIPSFTEFKRRLETGVGGGGFDRRDRTELPLEQPSFGGDLLRTATRGIGETGTLRATGEFSPVGFGAATATPTGRTGIREQIQGILSGIPGLGTRATTLAPEGTPSADVQTATQELIDKMQDFTDPDDFVDQLIEIDQTEGGGLENIVDLEQILEAFSQKFGDEAVRKLAERFNIAF